MIDRNTDTRIVGPSRERDEAEALPADAPSMRAASLSSLGICWRPARMRIMWKPKYFHEITKNRL